ncbi:hypothetical protein LMG31506_04789 [Cupriavidus yeoncheonensis]|uniref:DUF2219 family protein n=1 Tax=Cupriavidus yeoncheonensis TaxID=1462994 RepID=A0A916MZN2_9BURK|nr:hypothetical protein [Cupriavidus yeoncheonensis]CAG2153275.1 hypothetical protein LMG31506_04789 [Cupriavidus yeoncheonensis]
MAQPFLPVLLLAVAVSAAASDEVLDKRPPTQSPDLFESPEYDPLAGMTTDYFGTRDTTGFKRDSLRLGGMVRYASRYDFVSVGVSRDEFRQGDWTSIVDSVLVEGRRVNRRTAEGITGRLAVTTNTGHPQWHGEATWNVRFGERGGVELIANRDAVESQAALQNSILSNFLAAAFDYAPTERLTMVAMPTWRRFTDGNRQLGGRAWLIFTPVPESGIGIELKGQGFHGSGQSQQMYFNPAEYRKAEAGIRLRRSFGDWRVFAYARLGHEWIDHDIDKPTAEFGITARRTFSNGITAAVQFAYSRSSYSDAVQNLNENYGWRMLRVIVVLPFDSLFPSSQSRN